MKDIKKLMMTLALLLTAATGAWAQSAVASIGSENYTTLQAAFTAAETGQTIKLLSDVTQVGGVGKSDGKAVTFDLNGHIYTCTDDYSVMATYNSQITIIDSSTGTPGGIKSELALVGQTNGKIIIKAGRYNIGDLTAEELLEYFPNWCVEMYSGYTLQDITPADAQGFCVGVVAPASSAFDVDWNKAENTGSFSMPGGNVTLEPEYYPQAALTAAPTAINDVPATTDGAIVKAGTVKNIGETTTAQGTLMYYVSPSALDDAALLALAADQWTADVPTAAHLAQGQAYVYYYVRGNDSNNDEENFSDGDILAANALTVTIAAAPTYAVTFAEGTDPNEWKAEPNTGVTKGQTITVTYTGSKKVIGVKAEKVAAPAAAEGHALSASVVGEIVGTDGKAYAVADKDNLPSGVTAVAMVAYKSATAGSSLAIALADEGSMNWNSAKNTCGGKAAIGGHSWKLPSQNEWKQMFSANGGNEGSYSGLNSAITTAGGTALDNHDSVDFYWSSSEGGEENSAWYVRLASGGVKWFSLEDNKDDPVYVRACLAF